MTTPTHDTFLVCGTVRSGSSMSMRILEASGIPAIHDKRKHLGRPRAREHNPNGYYETSNPAAKISHAAGHCLKMLRLPNAEKIPKDGRYKILLTKRDTMESGRSWLKMMEIQNPTEAAVLGIAKKFSTNWQKIHDIVTALPNAEVLIFDYNKAQADPEKAFQLIEEFTGNKICRELAKQKKLIDKSLYRSM